MGALNILCIFCLAVGMNQGHGIQPVYQMQTLVLYLCIN